MNKNKVMLLKYNKSIIFLRTLFKQNDPIGLLDGGAPDDEYDCVLPQIIAKVNFCNTVEDVYNLLFDQFSSIGEPQVDVCKKNAAIVFKEFKY